MSDQAFPVVDAGPISLPFDDMLHKLTALDISFSQRGDGLRLKPAALLTAEVRAAAAEHKADLLVLADGRARLTLLFERTVALRFSPPGKGTSTDGVRWLSQEALKLAQMALDAGILCKDENKNAGYDDPTDPFADMAFDALMKEISEAACGLASDMYPASLPPYIDRKDAAAVFAAGRLLNGKFQNDKF